jgi:hypothetical protein
MHGEKVKKRRNTFEIHLTHRFMPLSSQLTLSATWNLLYHFHLHYHKITFINTSGPCLLYKWRLSIFIKCSTSATALQFVINPFLSYIGPRPTVRFFSSAPMSENVRHCFCCVCSPAVGAFPTLFLM